MAAPVIRQIVDSPLEVVKSLGAHEQSSIGANHPGMPFGNTLPRNEIVLGFGNV
jgi:hypothetical protein